MIFLSAIGFKTVKADEGDLSSLDQQTETMNVVQGNTVISSFEINPLNGKTSYLSGETVALSVAASLTEADNLLTQTTLQIKITKKHIHLSSLEASDISSQISKTITEDALNYVITYVLKTSNQGLIVSIPVSFKTDNGNTPNGYQFPITANIFGVDGKPLISEVEKEITIKTIRFNEVLALYQWGYNAWSPNPEGLSSTGGYADPDKPGYLSTNLNDLELKEFSFDLKPYTYNPYVNNDDTPGKRFYSKIVVENKIPKGALFSQADNPGWTYDDATRSARFEFEPTEPIKNFSENSLIYNNKLKLKFPGIKTRETLINSITVSAYVNNPESYEEVIVLQDDVRFSLSAKDKPSAAYNIPIYKSIQGTHKFYDNSKDRNGTSFWNVDIRNTNDKIFYPDANLENIVISEKNLDENLTFVEVRLSAQPNQVLFNGAEVDVIYEDGTIEKIDVSSDKYYNIIEFKKHVRSFTVTLKEGSHVKPGGQFSINPRTVFKNPDKIILNDDEEERKLYNYASITGNYVGRDAMTNETNSSLTVAKLRQYLRISKTAVNKKETYFINDKIEFNLDVNEYEMQVNNLIDTNLMVDLLPKGMEYIPGSTKMVRYKEYSTNISVSTTEYDRKDPQIIENFKGTGQTALVWQLPTHTYLYKAFNNTPVFKLSYSTKITSKAVSGMNTNKAFLSWKNTNDIIPFPNEVQEDIYDLNENGSIKDGIVSATETILYQSPIEVSASTETKGNLDQEYVGNPGKGFGEIGTETLHKYSITNNSASDLKTLYVLDLLPRLGDKSSSIDQTLALPKRVDRNSTFKLTLKGPVLAPEAFDVYYTTQLDSEFLSIPEFTRDANWTLSLLDYSQATAFKLVLKQGNLFKSGETKTFEVNFDIPQNKDLNHDDQAVNSFGIAIDDKLQYFESNNSTVKIIKYDIDGYIFEDKNENGVFDKKTETPFKAYTVQLVDEEGAIVNDLEGNPYITTTDQEGKYSFNLYRNGTYKIKVLTPSTYVPTNLSGALLGSSLSDSIKGETTAFVLNREFQNQQINAGYHIEKGDVLVQYVDTKGNTISKDVLLSQQVGTDWSSEQLTINGYKFKEVIGEVYGKHTLTQQTVRYVYFKEISGTEINPILRGEVLVQYLDTKGVSISDSITLKGQLGKAYLTEPLELNGYQFKEVIGLPKGEFTDALTKVSYVYYKEISGTVINPILRGEVLVQYLDTEGNPLSAELVLKGQVNSAWQAKLMIFDGYKIQEVIGDESGLFTDLDQEVTYVYLKLDEETERNDDVIILDDKPSTIPKSEITTDSNEISKNEILPSTGISSNFPGFSIIMLFSGLVLISLRKRKENE